MLRDLLVGESSGDQPGDFGFAFGGLWQLVRSSPRPTKLVRSAGRLPVVPRRSATGPSCSGVRLFGTCTSTASISVPGANSVSYRYDTAEIGKVNLDALTIAPVQATNT
ncbi:MAG: hypothetical protein QOI35_3659 [Cryptosporangiaceae bacterium]|jgi:hypothetical protein|nr:hypothetical protein [Cryptosporangiaceae bacterium]